MAMKYEVKYYILDTALSGKIDIGISHNNGNVELEYIDSEGRKGTLVSDSCHDLLWKLNEVYKYLGCELLCVGLLDNVYPGGLASDSTLQIAAYQIDPKARLKRKVNIFDGIEISDIKRISSKENQRLIRDNVLSKYDVGQFSLGKGNANQGNEKVKNVLDKYLK
jgi:hypothetical protein